MIVKFRSINWVYEWERSINFYHGHLIARLWNQHSLERWPTNFYWPKRRQYLLLNKRDTGFAYVDIKEVNRLSDNYLDKITKKDIAGRYVKQADTLVRSVIRFVSQHKKADLKKMDRKDFLKLFGDYFYYYFSLTGLVGEIRTVNWTGIEVLKSKIKRSFNNDRQLQKAVNILTATPRESFLNKSEKDFVKTLEKIKNNPNQSQKLTTDYWMKYRWFPCGFKDEAPLTYLETKKKITKGLREYKQLCKKIKQDEKFRANLKKQRTALLKKIKPDLGTKRIIDFLSQSTYYKDFTRFMINRWGHYEMIPVMKEAAKRLGISYKQLGYLSFEEIADGLRGEAVPRTEIRKRQLAWACVVINDRFRVLSGSQAVKLIGTFDKATTRIKELSGATANPGKASGEVVIVRNLRDARKAKTQGKIFVTTMTTPELMPYLRNVKAIITDEGGITCHAAIVSRELGIPCVIGTAQGTRVLKNGDRVEVNATDGVVKKIK